MGSNRHLISDKESGLSRKLQEMSDKLRGSLTAQGYQTREEFLFEAIKILQSFYTSMNEPSLEKPSVRPDDLPNPDDFNETFTSASNDLVSLFNELENLGLLIVANFNFVSTESNRLTSRMKAVSSKLGDYILYTNNPNRDSFYFKDSFNDLSKIDINSDLLNTEECEINKEEGIILLPLDKDKDPNVIITKQPIINASSNGTPGNNQELEASYNGTPSVILDNNPDTWFEYERVIDGTSEDKQSLILDMTLNLGSEKVINHVRVNPNNFGTKTSIQIDTIETSLDGQVYTNIKDDIPIAGFTTEDEENVFTLAPSTSKFAGQGLYTFTPRKVKYVHFTFRQDEPYTISTPSGERQRYAIGLRDIQIMAQRYKNVGEVVSVPFETLDEIRKVLIDTGQNPSQLSELASITYSLSADNGGTWHQIQPKDFDPLSGVVSVPEVIDFNGTSSNTISTPSAVKALRLKAILKREDTAFVDGAATLKKSVVEASELHSVSTGSFDFTLEHSPTKEDISIVDPLYGSMGRPETPYVLGYTNGNTRKFRIPLTNPARPFRKTGSGGSWNTEESPASDWINIEVGGEAWTHGVSGIDQYSNSDKVFVFDSVSGIVEFTEALPTDDRITMWFDSEKLFPNSLSDGHVTELKFATSSNKDDLVIQSYADETEFTEVLPYKATRINLSNRNIVSTTNLASELTSGSYTTPKTYVNGRDELEATTDWSIDMDNGILYLGSPTSSTSEVVISYTYQPITTLSNDDWEWVSDGPLKKKIKIKESGWFTREKNKEEITLPNSGYAFDLSSLAIVKDSATLFLTSGTGEQVDSTVHPFLKEVPFIDGLTEFGARVKKKTEVIGSLSTDGTKAIFDVVDTITDKTNFVVRFSDKSLFSNLVIGTPTAPGEYNVNRSTGQVTVYTATNITLPGKILYYSDDSSVSDNGLYSIDYDRGIVYTQRPLDSTWILMGSYRYTDYKAEYKIARLLASSSYELDRENRTVRITDKEILDRLTSPHLGLNSSAGYYLVNYSYVSETREDVEELKDFFSPVLKDYALRILTKGNVF